MKKILIYLGAGLFLFMVVRSYLTVQASPDSYSSSSHRVRSSS